MDGFQRHFDSQLLAYGKQTILNLVRTLTGPHLSTVCVAESCAVSRKARQLPHQTRGEPYLTFDFSKRAL